MCKETCGGSGCIHTCILYSHMYIKYTVATEMYHKFRIFMCKILVVIQICLTSALIGVCM